MDPEACVKRAEELADGLHDPEEAGWACTDYWEWKARGGWTRPDLDARIRAVEEKLGVN